MRVRSAAAAPRFPPERSLLPAVSTALQRPRPDARGDRWETPTSAGRGTAWAKDGPPILPVGYNNNLDVLQGPGFVAVRNEMVHATRLIPVDASRPHVGSRIRQWSGDSRGRWE